LKLSCRMDRVMRCGARPVVVRRVSHREYADDMDPTVRAVARGNQCRIADSRTPDVVSARYFCVTRSM